MFSYLKANSKPGLVALYDIRPRNRSTLTTLEPTRDDDDDDDDDDVGVNTVRIIIPELT